MKRKRHSPEQILAKLRQAEWLCLLPGSPGMRGCGAEYIRTSRLRKLYGGRTSQAFPDETGATPKWRQVSRRAGPESAHHRRPLVSAHL